MTQTQLNTIEDIDTRFPDELTARKFLSIVRWGDWASCPYCGNAKAYFIEGGSRYKCANKECYKKFSVTIKTMLEGTNISLDMWIKIIFVYIKKRGYPSFYDLEAATDCSPSTIFYATEKLDFVWPLIDRTGKQAEDIIKDVFIQFVRNYDRYNEIKQQPFYKNPFHISELTDITEQKQYNILERFINYYISVFASTWIFNKTFAHPKEVMTEIFLYLKDNNIKEYNVDSILKITWKVINRMWNEYIKAHPNLDRKRAAKIKLHKESQRINLTNSYIAWNIKRSTKEGKKMSIKDIYNNKVLMEKTREVIIEKRKKAGRNYEFISHFS